MSDLELTMNTMPPPSSAQPPRQWPQQTAQFATSPAPLPTGEPPAQPPQPQRKSWLAMSVVAVVAGLVGSAGTVGLLELRDDQVVTPGATVTQVIHSDGSNPDWTVTAAAAAQSVVAIQVTGAQGQGEGSGVVLDDTGRIVTNHHVVNGSRQVTVTLSDRRRYEARVVASDPSTDLAVLQMVDPPADLIPITFADGSDLRVGQPVMALGNPLGLSETVTTGIISALDRPVVTIQESGGGGFASAATSAERVVTNAIQTNAAINPGNSGGALVNADGELIGITSSIATLGAQGQSGNLGIGFAIPGEQVRAVTDQLISQGRAAHAYLGVATTDQATTLAGAGYVGAGVQSVEADTPADDGGVQVGDVIIGVDDDPVTGSEGLVAQIRDRRPGDQVALKIIRTGAEISVPLTLTIVSD